MEVNAIKHDGEKTKWEYFPWRAAQDVMEVMQHGAAKYGWNNWRKGFTAMRLWSATMRHLIGWLWNETDEDSGKNHLAHAACNLLFMLDLQKDGMLVDDRKESMDSDVNIERSANGGSNVYPNRLHPSYRKGFTGEG